MKALLEYFDLGVQYCHMHYKVLLSYYALEVIIISSVTNTSIKSLQSIGIAVIKGKETGWSLTPADILVGI